MKKCNWRILISGFAAGAINGLLGAGGGMVLVPLLISVARLKDDEVFPVSVSMILPICLVSLSYSLVHSTFDWQIAPPYLLGSTLGGLLAGLYAKRIPTLWLHRILGVLIIWGGFRYIW